MKCRRSDRLLQGETLTACAAKKLKFPPTLVRNTVEIHVRVMQS
jgi:hypothetical protein